MQFDYADAIRRCARGDTAGLTELYQRDAPIMLNVAYRILRRRDLAEEAVNDTFVRLWRYAANLDVAKGDGRAWMFAILRNRSIDILHGARRDELTDEDLLSNEPDCAPDPEKALLLTEMSACVDRYLEQVDPRWQRAIKLVYLSGMSHAEAAAKLCVPLGTAKSWIRRGVIRMQKYAQAESLMAIMVVLAS